MRKAKKRYPQEVIDVIPDGYYCYKFDSRFGVFKNFFKSLKRDKYGYVCPFWFKIDNLPEQECGYCALLGKSDYEMNREKYDLIMTYCKDGKQKRKLIHCGPDNPSGMSLLWDMCKECGVKEFDNG